MPDEHEGAVIEFATRTIFADPNADKARDESRNSICELIQSFGEQPVMNALRETPLATRLAIGEERTLQMLRSLVVILIESPRPKLIANLVGKLCHLEKSTRQEVRLEDLARRNGMTKQAISKTLAELADQLNLPRPLSTEKARRSHQLMNRRNRSICAA